MKKKDNQNSVVAFGVHGWFHIIYMMLMFWFYVGMINDGSNNIAGKIAEHMLGSRNHRCGTVYRNRYLKPQDRFQIYVRY